MPGEVGCRELLDRGWLQYMQDGPQSLQGVLDDIEAGWPAS